MTKKFSETRWTMVIRAQDGSEAALSGLCELYWFPLYAYVRRRGYSRQDSEDLTQGFFFQLLQEQGLQKAEQERGRLRSFLLRSLEFFLRDEWDKSQAQKRGGGVTILSLDSDLAEGRLQSALAHDLHDVDHQYHYDRDWAVTLLENTFNTLRLEFQPQGNSNRFEALKPFLTLDDQESYLSVSRKLNITEAAVRGSIFRLRRRFREVLIEQVAETIGAEDEIDAELAYLVKLFVRRDERA